MKALILSCNTGEGHNAAARAMKERIEHEGHQAVLLDVMSLAGARTSRIVGGTYVNIVRYEPKVFHLMYDAGMKISSNKHKSPVYFANSLMAPLLAKYLDENDYDVILMPHLFPAEMVTNMKKRGLLKIPTVAIATDYTCIPFWEETDCDYYIAPHAEMIKDYIKRGMSEEKLYPYGIPVSLKFSMPRSRFSSREALGMNQEANQILVMGGSMGFGRMVDFTGRLLSQLSNADRVTVICGNNPKLYDELANRYAANPRLSVVGYTDRVALYMSASDVLFSKPGGLTSTEAAVCGVPLIHTDPIPGCETENARFFNKHGMSLTVDGIEAQARLGLQLAADHDAGERMRLSQRATINADASLDIFNLCLRAVADRQ